MPLPVHQIAGHGDAGLLDPWPFGAVLGVIEEVIGATRLQQPGLIETARLPGARRMRTQYGLANLPVAEVCRCSQADDRRTRLVARAGVGMVSTDVAAPDLAQRPRTVEPIVAQDAGHGHVELGDRAPWSAAEQQSLLAPGEQVVGNRQTGLVPPSQPMKVIQKWPSCRKGTAVNRMAVEGALAGDGGQHQSPVLCRPHTAQQSVNVHRHNLTCGSSRPVVTPCRRSALWPAR